MKSHPGRPSEWLGARLTLAEALEPVVRDGLPGRRVGDVRTPARAHARIAVEGPQAHAHLCGVLGVAAEEVRPALPAKALLETAVRRAPGFHQLLSLQQPEGPAVDPRLCRRSRPRASLAASAVAVPRSRRRLGELEADASAQAASRHRGIGHGIYLSITDSGC